MAAKIKDGLFIGDEDTSKDPEFLDLNKISNLVNLAGKDVNNTWSTHGLVYLTYNWEDRPDYNLFDKKDDTLVDMIEFIDTSLRHGVSVLLFSKRGVGRCAVAVSAYLMCKYHWGFEKTFAYISSKKLDVDINDGFVVQLCYLEKKIKQLRHQILQNLFITLDLNHGQKDTLLAIENMRFKDWDPSYIDLERKIGTRSSSSKQNTTNGTKFSGRLINALNTTPSDEMVVINSYNNSRQTIAELPGPFVNALNIPKIFKLKFNLDAKTPSSPTTKSQSSVHTTTKPIRGAMKGSRQNSRLQQAVLTKTVDKQKRDLNMLPQQPLTSGVNINNNNNNSPSNASAPNTASNSSAVALSKPLSRGKSLSSPSDSSNSYTIIYTNNRNNLLNSESKDNNINASSNKIVSQDTLRHPSSNQQQQILSHNGISQATELANNTVSKFNSSFRNQAEPESTIVPTSFPTEERLQRIVSNMDQSRRDQRPPISQQQPQVQLQTLQKSDDIDKLLIQEMSSNARPEIANKIDASMPQVLQSWETRTSTRQQSTTSVSNPTTKTSSWPSATDTNSSELPSKLPPNNHSSLKDFASTMKSFEAMQLEGIVRARHDINPTEFECQSSNVRISAPTTQLVAPNAFQNGTVNKFPRGGTFNDSFRSDENICAEGSNELTDISLLNRSDNKPVPISDEYRSYNTKSLQNSVPKVYRHGSPVVMRSSRQMSTASSSSGTLGRGSSSNRPPARSAWSNIEFVGMDRDRGSASFSGSMDRPSDTDHGPQISTSSRNNSIVDPSVKTRYTSPITLTRASPRPASPMSSLRSQVNSITSNSGRPSSPSTRNIGQHQSTATTKATTSRLDTSVLNTSLQHSSSHLHSATSKAISGTGKEETFHMGATLQDFRLLNENSSYPNSNAYSHSQNSNTRIRNSYDTQTQSVRQVTSPPDGTPTNLPRSGSFSARPSTPTRAWRF